METIHDVNRNKELRLHHLAVEAESIFARAIRIPTTEQISTKHRLRRVAEINKQLTPTEFWAKRFEDFTLAPSVYEFIMDPRTKKFFMKTITLANMDSVLCLIAAYRNMALKVKQQNLIY